MILELYINGELVRTYMPHELSNRHIDDNIHSIRSYYGLFQTSRNWFILRYKNDWRFKNIVYQHEMDLPKFITVKSVPLPIKKKPQRKTSRTFRMIEHNGSMMNLKEACRQVGLAHQYRNILYRIIGCKMNFQKAITFYQK